MKTYAAMSRGGNQHSIIGGFDVSYRKPVIGYGSFGQAIYGAAKFTSNIVTAGLIRRPYTDFREKCA